MKISFLKCKLIISTVLLILVLNVGARTACSTGSCCPDDFTCIINSEKETHCCPFKYGVDCGDTLTCCP